MKFNATVEFFKMYWTVDIDVDAMAEHLLEAHPDLTDDQLAQRLLDKAWNDVNEQAELEWWEDVEVDSISFPRGVLDREFTRHVIETVREQGKRPKIHPNQMRLGEV